MDFRVDCSKYNYETPLSVEELLLKSIKIDLIETSTYFNKVKGNKRIFYAISIENLAEYFELSNEIIIFFSMILNLFILIVMILSIIIQKKYYIL